MKANTDKSHLLITTNEEKYFFICGETMQNGKNKNFVILLYFADFCYFART